MVWAGMNALKEWAHSMRLTVQHPVRAQRNGRGGRMTRCKGQSSIVQERPCDSYAGTPDISGPKGPPPLFWPHITVAKTKWFNSMTN